MIDIKPSRQNDNNNSREDTTASTTSLTELRRKYKLETIRFNAAKARHQTHLASIEKEYISANYPFKEGDVVRIFVGEPILIVIDRMYFTYRGSEEATYNIPIVRVDGHAIDEEGYDLFYFPDSDQKVSYIKDADDIKERVDIIPKGRRK